MPEPLVSIVLLNWNGNQHVHRCIQHVLSQTYSCTELIVVDNGSEDGSIQAIKRNHPSLRYIQNECNLGFAAGMNQGISASNGEYVIPLNQDVCLDPEFIENCVRRAERSPTIGAIGGRVFSWIGDELTCELRRGEGERYLMRKRFQADAGNQAEGECSTFGVSGSFPFFRRKMLEDIRCVSGHYYDESFETGWEDGDIFFRMHLRGWDALFYPEAFGWHVGSGSVGGNDTFFTKKADYQKRILRNRYFTIIKDLPLPILFWLLPYLIVTEIGIIPLLLLRSPKTISALFRSWLEVVGSIPSLLSKRRRIMSSVLVPADALKQYFVRF